MTVLIVEDDTNMADALRACIEPVAREIRIAHELPSALGLMGEKPHPNLVLLDLRLPGSTAENTLQHIETFKEINPEALVFAVTGMPDPSLPALAQSLGADAFVSKKELVSQRDLLRVIQENLAMRRDTKEPAYKSSVTLLERIAQLTFALMMFPVNK